MDDGPSVSLCEQRHNLLFMSLMRGTVRWIDFVLLELLEVTHTMLCKNDFKVSKPKYINATTETLFIVALEII